MAQGGSRRVGRPSRNVLDRDRIFRAALDLVDRGGAEALTMMRLATKLGVEPASLYNHVSGRHDIVEGVRGLIVTSIALPDFSTQTWVAALRTWANGYRSALAAHPRSIQILATTPIRSEHSMLMYEEIVKGLRNAGWPIEQIADVLTTLESFLIGSALDLAAPSLMYDAQDRSAEYPQLVEALGGPNSQAGRADRAFEFGLDLLLTALESKHPGPNA